MGFQFFSFRGHLSRRGRRGSEGHSRLGNALALAVDELLAVLEFKGPAFSFVFGLLGRGSKFSGVGAEESDPQTDGGKVGLHLVPVR
jgi:hypothetical protein